MADVVFTAVSTINVRYTSNVDGTVTVEHVDVGRNPAPPVLLYIIPATSVSTVKDFFDNL